MRLFKEKKDKPFQAAVTHSEYLLLYGIRTAHISKKMIHYIKQFYSQVFHSACASSFLSGSLTVEAALCLPILLFSVYFLMAPLHVMETQRKLQNVMEASAKDMAQAAYLSRQADHLLKESVRKEASIETLIKAAGTGAVRAKILHAASADGVLEQPRFVNKKILDFAAGQENGSETGIAAAAEDIYGDRSEKEENNEMIQMELRYNVRFPIPVFQMKPVSLSSVVSRRAWVGAKGGRGRYQYGQQAADGWDRDAEGKIIVYVGKNGTRYHKERNCHYIYNKLQAVSGSKIDSMHNSSGARYQPCISCKPSKKGMVYIFEEGKSYHAGADCKAIGSYAKAVRLEEAENLGPCSYCST